MKNLDRNDQLSFTHEMGGKKIIQGLEFSNLWKHGEASMNGRKNEKGRALSPRSPRLLGVPGRAVFCAFLSLFVAINSLAGASRSPSPDFQHEISTETKPWNHERFDAAEGKFTFALFSDLTGGERADVFKVAVAQLNLLRPELIVNVGDLIEGDSKEAEELNRQWDSFDARADQARAPIFYAGGNHDLTGMTLRKVWKDRLEPTFYHFIYKNVLFLVLDTEDNTPERMAEIEKIRTEGIEVYKTQGPDAFKKTAYSTLPERESGRVGNEQADYFLKVIQQHPEVRWTFVLSHKPAWLRENEENFAAIEKALKDQPYTVFYGHTHIYQYEERHGRDYINLATTGGKFFPDLGQSMDHVMLVTVDENEATLVNLKLSGILDKTGKLPLNGEELEFEK
jgi:predicted phosphodiesterase